MCLEERRSMAGENPLKRCQLILSGQGGGTGGAIADEQISCNKIESILPILMNQQPNSEYPQLIQPCLRTILQYWTKGSQSLQNKWSTSCIGLATALASLLPSQPSGDYSKYFKLLGFVLAKASLMGTVSRALQVCNRRLASPSLRRTRRLFRILKPSFGISTPRDSFRATLIC
jgi:hypothetical protein